MPGIGVVVNPKSRRNVGDPGAATRLARRLGDHGVVRAACSIDELYRIAEDFRRAQIDVLAISGGDGTNHITLTGFLDVYGATAIPRIALLRGGTMNTVANSVGVRQGKPEGLLGRLIRDYARRASAPLEDVTRNMMHVAPSEGQRGHYGFLFGTGVVHGFLAEYYRGGDPTPLVAVKTLARGIGSAFVRGETIRRIARPFRGSVRLDQGQGEAVWEERDYLTVAAGTIAHVGLNFKPFHRYAEQPGAFHALAVHASPLSLVTELPSILRGRPMRPGKAREALSSRMVVRSAEGPLRYMIDGDLHEAPGEVAVTIGPPVRLVVAGAP
jgi:diacylglycerol kinase (ATP)